MPGVLIKKGNLEIDKHMGSTQYEDESKDIQAKEYQRLPANHQKLAREGWNSLQKELTLLTP